MTTSGTGDAQPTISNTLPYLAFEFQAPGSVLYPGEPITTDSSVQPKKATRGLGNDGPSSILYPDMPSITTDSAVFSSAPKESFTDSPEPVASANRAPRSVLLPETINITPKQTPQVSREDFGQALAEQQVTMETDATGIQANRAPRSILLPETINIPPEQTPQASREDVGQALAELHKSPRNAVKRKYVTMETNAPETINIRRTSYESRRKMAKLQKVTLQTEAMWEANYAPRSVLLPETISITPKQTSQVSTKDFGQTLVMKTDAIGAQANRRAPRSILYPAAPSAAHSSITSTEYIPQTPDKRIPPIRSMKSQGERKSHPAEDRATSTTSSVIMGTVVRRRSPLLTSNTPQIRSQIRGLERQTPGQDQTDSGRASLVGYQVELDTRALIPQWKAKRQGIHQKRDGFPYPLLAERRRTEEDNADEGIE